MTEMKSLRSSDTSLLGLIQFIMLLSRSMTSLYSFSYGFHITYLLIETFYPQVLIRPPPYLNALDDDTGIKVHSALRKKPGT